MKKTFAHKERNENRKLTQKRVGLVFKERMERSKSYIYYRKIFEFI